MQKIALQVSNLEMILLEMNTYLQKINMSLN